jgi:hypothetical protein
MKEFIDIIVGAAAGDIVCYIIFCCLAAIGYFIAIGIIKLSGLPKLIALAWALDKKEEDDIYDPEEGE